MSRSFRHTPIIGNAGVSDKEGKRKANRRERKSVRSAIFSTLCGNADFDGLALPLLREVSDVWSFPKDGKHYMNLKHRPRLAEFMRK